MAEQFLSIQSNFLIESIVFWGAVAVSARVTADIKNCSQSRYFHKKSTETFTPKTQIYTQNNTATQIFVLASYVASCLV